MGAVVSAKVSADGQIVRVPTIHARVRSVPFTTTLPRDAHERLREIAQRADAPMSVILAEAIRALAMPKKRELVAKIDSPAT